MRARRTGLAAAALCVGLGLCFPAQAYKRTLNSGNLPLFWATRGHPFIIDSRGTPDVVGAAAFEAIRRSFATWSAVSCSDLVFEDQGLSTNASDRKTGYFEGETNHNLVLFRTANCHDAAPPDAPCHTTNTCSNQYDCWEKADEVIASTLTTSNRYTGQILDSDIEINNSAPAAGVRIPLSTIDGPPCNTPQQHDCAHVDIQNTVTHEAGHTLGLDHSPDRTATMFATTPPGGGEISKRTLGADDVQALCDIYPRGARTKTDLQDPIRILPVPGEAPGSGCATTGTSGAEFIFLAVWAARRVRRSGVRLAAGR